MSLRLLPKAFVRESERIGMETQKSAMSRQVAIIQGYPDAKGNDFGHALAEACAMRRS
jgi:hypothetical protein